MKALPKVSKGSINEITNKSIKPMVAGIVAGVIAGVAVPAMASTNAGELITAPALPQTAANPAGQQTNTAIIMAKPTLEGQAFAAHYSHSSHASHASHYSCTPGSTC
ncbi:hypothetical protein [Scandinavium goeteborgense]|uniref:Uncharacterized protein n=1 Tax=Scandinavium goeteborgense TaxID=1851514 RepID=A0A4V3BP01_SCAGO|nr:hypothetical protein [Scandinavium goeteborgense]TDN56591.1 hypothetical protein EC847_11096 [Scandinavium goeteborgense]